MLPREDELAGWRRRLAAATPTPLADTPALRAALEGLERAERRVAELAAKRIVVGLLGGTGVGKSALLNALAGAEISRSGERRPTTDRIVCHRHEADPLPEWLAADDLASAAAPHAASALRGVVLLDLPDVDGWKAEHRARAWRVLPQLDLLLVVSSVEKYADRVLYDELHALPQAARNRVFVLNKSDRLDAAALALVSADFATKLAAHAGAVGPRVLATSALEATRGGDGGLAPLRALLAGLGADAERRAVLEANAARAVSDAGRALDAALPREPIARSLAALDATLEPAVTAGPRERERLRADIEAEIGPWLRATARAASWFPIGWIDFWARRLRRGGVEHTPLDPAARPGGLAAEHTDALLARPLAIARQRAEEALRASQGTLALSLPPLPSWTDANVHDPGLAFPAVEAWLAELPGRARRLAWKLRQHLLPGLALAAFVAWLAAALQAAPADERCARALFAALAQAADAVTLSGVAWTLGLLVAWYALVWSYFVYRLAQGVHDEAARGAEAHLADFADHWDAIWRRPLRAEGARMADVLADLETARAALGRTRG